MLAGKLILATGNVWIPFWFRNFATAAISCLHWAVLWAVVWDVRGLASKNRLGSLVKPLEPSYHAYDVLSQVVAHLNHLIGRSFDCKLELKSSQKAGGTAISLLLLLIWGCLTSCAWIDEAKHLPLYFDRCILKTKFAIWALQNWQQSLASERGIYFGTQACKEKVTNERWAWVYLCDWFAQCWSCETASSSLGLNDDFEQDFIETIALLHETVLESLRNPTIVTSQWHYHRQNYHRTMHNEGY